MGESGRSSSEARPGPGRHPRARRPVTPRAVVVGLLLSALFSVIVPYVDVYMSDTFLGSCHLPPGAVFVLLMLVLVVNPVLRLLGKRLAFDRAELLTIYCFLLFSLLVPGHGAENVFIPVAITPYYYANAENKWLDLFGNHLPSWTAPQSRSAVVGFFEGLQPGQSIPWGEWLVPLAAWTVYSIGAYGLVLFLSVILHRQWDQAERIYYPLVRLPQQMVEHADRPFAPGSFFRSGAMWIGFGLAAFLALMNGMNFYVPAWPRALLECNFQALFHSKPWWSVGWVPGRIWPVVVGTTVLLRSEVSFSLWAWWWLMKLQLVAADALGYAGVGQGSLWGPSWLVAQSVGATMAYVGLAFWAARGHLRNVMQLALGRRLPTRDEHEAVPYRLCAWGFAASFALLVGWQLAAGAGLYGAVVQPLVYVFLCIMLTRLVADAGVLFVQSTWYTPEFLGWFVGGARVGAPTIVVSTLIERSYHHDQRAFIMPSFVQSWKIADDEGLSSRRLSPWLLVTIGIATVLCYYMSLKLIYTYGGMACNPWHIQGAGPGGFWLAANYLQAPRPVNLAGIAALGLGLVVTVAVFYVRRQYAWFPLHPVGYLIPLSYAMHQLWFSVFLGWVFKAVINRYGGPKGLRRLMPGFLGLAFGDIFMMVVFLIVDALKGVHNHYLMPG